MRPIYVVAVLLFLAACNPQAAVMPTPLPTALVSSATPQPTKTPGLPFTAVTYRDEEAGFELEYPASWFLMDGETQSRGAYVQITSWDPGPGGIQSIPEGGSVLQIAIYLWEPTHNLDARLAMRRDSFTASGNSILEEEELSPAGERVVRLKLRLTDGSQALFYLAVLGDRYLELSGSGDLAALDASMRTLRIDGPQQ